MKKIVVLASGRGSNLSSLISHQEQGDYTIASVIADNPSAQALSIAQAAKISTGVIDGKAFPKEHFSDPLKKLVSSFSPDFVVLAGFMRILRPNFIEEFPNRIINIHPSLLPNFPGLDTHARALADHASTHGCTVHLVDAGIDTGTILAQASVSISPGETAESLATKVLEREHALLPWVIRRITTRALNLKLSPPQYSKIAQLEAKKLGFHLP